MAGWWGARKPENLRAWKKSGALAFDPGEPGLASEIIQRVNRQIAAILAWLAGAVLIGLGYGAVRFVYLIDRPSLGVSQISRSVRDSQASGFYVGHYTPNPRQVTLRDSSVIVIQDAWVEHSWTPELTWLLRDTQKMTSGYNVCIPIPQPSNSPFVYGIEIAQSDRRFTRYPGMGYSINTGCWDAFFDTLPDMLTFVVKEKKRSHDPWTAAVVTSTIEFKRGP
jgi:hypothetical protein